MEEITNSARAMQVAPGNDLKGNLFSPSGFCSVSAGTESTARIRPPVFQRHSERCSLHPPQPNRNSTNSNTHPRKLCTSCFCKFTQIVRKNSKRINIHEEGLVCGNAYHSVNPMLLPRVPATCIRCVGLCETNGWSLQNNRKNPNQLTSSLRSLCSIFGILRRFSSGG